MGTPRKHRRKFARPKHPWRAERITEEKELCKKFGLRNKREAWSAKSMLGRVRQQARLLLAATGDEAEKERRELIAKLNNLGIKVESIEDVLGLTVEDFLSRRLQSMVHVKGLANTPKQARQFIVHSHVWVGDHKVTVPGYLVGAKDEGQIRVAENIKVDEVARKEPE